MELELSREELERISSLELELIRDELERKIPLEPELAKEEQEPDAAASDRPSALSTLPPFPPQPEIRSTSVAHTTHLNQTRSVIMFPIPPEE